MDNYFGTYARFDAPSKRDAAMLLGADNMVGDIYSVEGEINEEGEHAAWLVNRFGQKSCRLEPEISRKLSIYAARGLVVCAVLSFVAFTDHPDEGHYWGEVAVICFEQREEEAFTNFLNTVSARMADGIRTKVDFDASGVKNIVESGGEWVPKQTVPMPEVVKEKGTAVMKNRRKTTDRLIEKGRAGNKGCYVVSWVFLLALVAAILWGIKSCAGF